MVNQQPWGPADVAEDTRAALALGVLYFYESADKAQYVETLEKNPEWFVLNDAKATGYPLALHSCGCNHFKATGTTNNWAKIIGETRATLTEWAEKRRPNYEIKSCGLCLK